MRRTRFLFLSILVSCSGLMGGQILTRPGSMDASRSISVSGEAVLYVVPDEAIVHLGIETFAPSLGEAKSASDARGAELVEAVRSLGIDEKHLQADHADVEIVYPKDGIAAGIAGYRVRRAYGVTLHEVRRLDDGTWGSWGYSQNQMTQNASVSAGGSSEEGDTLAPLGQIGVRAQVSVTFDLIPGPGLKPSR